MSTDATQGGADALDVEFTQARRTLDEAVARVEELDQRVAALRERTASRAEVEERHSRLLDALASVQQHHTAMESHAELRDRRIALHDAVASRRNALEAERDRLVAETQRMEQVTNRRASLPAERAALEAEGKEAIARLESELATVRDRADAFQREAAALDDRLKAIVEEGTAARARLKLIGEAQSECTLCGQPVTAELLADLAARYQAEIDRLLEQHRAASADLKRARNEHLAVSARAAALNGELQERRRALATGLARLDAIEREAERLGPPLVTALEDLELLEDRLITGEYAEAELDELLAVDHALEQAGHDMAAYRRAVATAAELAGAADAYEALQRDLAALAEAESALTEAERAATEAGGRVKELATLLEAQ